MDLAHRLVHSGGPPRSFETWPLLEITRQIANGRDRTALAEFHRRSLFEVAGGQHVRFSEWVNVIRGWAHEAGFWRKHGSDVVDFACDMLMDRFSNLPAECDDDAAVEKGEDRLTGPDCRKYFAGFLTYAERVLERDDFAGALAAEARAALALQRFAKRHFYLCVLEALRGINPLISRYAWKLNGTTYNLWFPKTLSGRKRRDWLEEHIGQPCCENPWEEQRIQAVIEERLQVPRLTSLDSCPEIPHVSSPAIPSPCQAAMDAEGKGIREAIADEKAALVDKMRPAIRELGRAKLRSLVVDILMNLDEPRKSHAEIARKAGISCSTLSRFAGERWREKDGGAVPDLWTNIANIAASTPAFVEAAKAMRLLETVTKIVDDADSTKA